MIRRSFLLAALAAGATLGQTLVGPGNNSVHTASIVNFGWNIAPGPGERFQMKVFNTTTGVLELALEFPGYVNSEAYTFRSGNYRVETRVCRLLCVNGATSVFSVVNRTTPPPAPRDVACSLQSEDAQNRLDCQWRESEEADFYFARAVQAESGPGGGALTIAGKQTGRSGVSLLVPNGPVSFLVQGCTGDVCGPQSAAIPLHPNSGDLKVPILSSPLAGSSFDSGASAPAVLFAWNRIAGDPGDGRVLYRLFVQDFSRSAAAFDVFTANNYHAGYLNPAVRYDAVVIAYPNPKAFFPPPIAAPVQGPPSAFIVRGKIPNAPVFVSPGFGSFPGTQYPLDRIAWTPIPDDRGETLGVRRYQYRLTESDGTVAASGVTDRTFALVPVFPANVVPVLGDRRYTAILRACTTGFACVPDSDVGWGPWTTAPGSEGAHGDFSIDKNLRLGQP